MDVNLFLISLFGLGWIILYKSKTERYYGTFYIMRSNYGMRLISSIANLAPSLWRFLADFSIFLSFGGLGGYYLSKDDLSRGNFRKSFLVLGFLAVITAFFSGYSITFAAGSSLLVLMAYAMSGRMRSTIVDFTLSSIIMSVITYLPTNNMLLSVFVGVFGLPALLIYALTSHGITILYGETDLPGVSPLLPSSREGNIGVAFPGYDLFIPWWYALLAIIITLGSHEISHGVLTRVCGVKLKSTGLLTIGSFPIGAFVEPDEDELNKRSGLDRMRVYTMGSFANFAVGITSVLVILLAMSLLSNHMVYNGVRIVGFIEGYPAEEYLAKDSIIHSINSMPLSNVEGFLNATSSLKAGERVTLNTSSGVRSFTMAENPTEPGKGYMGVYVTDDVSFTGLMGFISTSYVSVFLKALEWIIFFNINIGLVNLLPLLPFDGGRMFKELVYSTKLRELDVKRIMYTIIVFTVVVFIVNVIPLFQMIVLKAYDILGLN
ncbi:MAG: M50 family metallopeptidase [Candidatus Altiarchaeota archaeon]